MVETCSYCGKLGHSIQECLKWKEKEVATATNHEKVPIPMRYIYPDIYLYASMIKNAMYNVSMGDIAEAESNAFQTYVEKYFIEYKRKEEELYAEKWKQWKEWAYQDIPSEILSKLRDYIHYFEKILATEGVRVRVAKESWKADWALKRLKELLEV